MTEEQKKADDIAAWTGWLEEYRARLEQDVAEDGKNLEEFNRRRRETMDANNPKFILRNYIAESAIREAENGDFSEVSRR